MSEAHALCYPGDRSDQKDPRSMATRNMGQKKIRDVTGYQAEEQNFKAESHLRIFMGNGRQAVVAAHASQPMPSR